MVLSGNVGESTITKADKLPSNQDLQVLAFLDTYFGVNSGHVDAAPELKRTFYMNLKWKRLYNLHYIPHCNELDQRPVTRQLFSSIRVKYRPNFKRHMSQEKGIICLMIHIYLIFRAYIVYVTYLFNIMIVLLSVRRFQSHGVWRM